MPATFENDVIHMSFEGDLTFDGFQLFKRSLHRCGIRREYSAIRISERPLRLRGPFETLQLQCLGGGFILVFACDEDNFLGITGNRPHLLVDPSQEKRWSHVGHTVRDVKL